MSNILVIDDDELIAELLQSVLAEGGHRATAIASLEQLVPERYDLVVTDLLSASPYSLPNAAELVAEVRRRVPGAPVVVCTAHHAAGQDGPAIGADAVITKPFDVDALLGLVDRLASGGTG